MTTTKNEPAGIVPAGGYEGAYIAHIWEHPNLCVAIFGVQFHTPAGQERFSEIQGEVHPALEAAKAEGHLLTRPVPAEGGVLLIQYWRSYDDLDRWARMLPHMRWWRWLLQNAGPDLGFYHEIYQVKTAEAIFEKGCTPVGPALFTTTSPVVAGEGRSKERQQKFAGAAQQGNRA